MRLALLKVQLQLSLLLLIQLHRPQQLLILALIQLAQLLQLLVLVHQTTHPQHILLIIQPLGIQQVAFLVILTVVVGLRHPRMFPEGLAIL